MNDALYKIYYDLRNLIKKAQASECPGAEERSLVEEWQSAAEIIENMDSNFKTRYERLVTNQKTLTPEQIDFICYQIGDWYLEWKDRLVIDLKKGEHRLGYAKEQLKTLICGE
jgi:hypothetical protein